MTAKRPAIVSIGVHDPAALERGVDRPVVVEIAAVGIALACTAMNRPVGV